MGKQEQYASGRCGPLPILTISQYSTPAYVQIQNTRPLRMNGPWSPDENKTIKTASHRTDSAGPVHTILCPTARTLHTNTTYIYTYIYTADKTLTRFSARLPTHKYHIYLYIHTADKTQQQSVSSFGSVLLGASQLGRPGRAPLTSSRPSRAKHVHIWFVRKFNLSKDGNPPRPPAPPPLPKRAYPWLPVEQPPRKNAQSIYERILAR